MHCLWIKCRQYRTQSEQVFVDKLHLLTRCISCKFLSDRCICQFAYSLQAQLFFPNWQLTGCPTYPHTSFLMNNFQLLIKSGSNWRSILCLLINLQWNVFLLLLFFINTINFFCLLWLFFHIPTGYILHWYQGSNSLLEASILVVSGLEWRN